MTVISAFLPCCHNIISHFSYFQLLFKITAVWETSIHVVIESSLATRKTLTNPLS